MDSNFCHINNSFNKFCLPGLKKFVLLLHLTLIISYIYCTYFLQTTDLYFPSCIDIFYLVHLYIMLFYWLFFLYISFLKLWKMNYKHLNNNNNNKSLSQIWYLQHECHDLDGSFNIKISYQYRESHCKDKTVFPPSYLYNGNSNAWKNGLCIEKGPRALTMMTKLESLWVPINSSVYVHLYINNQWINKSNYVDHYDYELTHYGLVTPSTILNLVHHWFRSWLVP